MRKLLFLPLALLFSCVQVNKDDNGVEVSVGSKENKIRNGIQITEHGLKAEQAFLLYEDNSLVPEGNVTNIKKKLFCRVIVKGWKQKDGKVFPGAAEKIETSEGNVFLDEADLFKAYDEQGVSPADAEYITLTAVITSVDKLYDYFVVKFKVWDKISNDYLEGSFKFKVQ